MSYNGFWVLVLMLGTLTTGEPSASASNSTHGKTKEVKGGDKVRWNHKYKGKDYLFGVRPVDWVRDSAPFFPKAGKALDIAMGEGRNAVFLAKQGLDVTGVDISEVGIKKAKKLAAKNGVKLNTEAVDLKKYQLKPNSYDVIVMTYFLQRDLFPQIKKALKKGGVAVIESYNHEYLKINERFKPLWALKHNELLDTFSEKGFKVLRYQAVHEPETTAFSSILVQKI